MVETIVILDFGSPYSPLIARRVRESQVYAELLSWDTPEKAVMALNPKGFILSGNLRSALEPGAPALPGYAISQAPDPGYWIWHVSAGACPWRKGDLHGYTEIRPSPIEYPTLKPDIANWR